MKRLKKEITEFKLLLRSIPVIVVTLFVVSVICMNLLANKTLLQLDWIALDGGILISWLSFMCMDIITKHFGPKASNRISILAAGINLLTCLIFFVASVIPSTADDYTAFDGIFGGTWFILLGSTVAFLASAVINNSLNWMIGRGFCKNPDSKIAYATRTYISTFIGQFLDNLIFSVIVFMFFMSRSQKKQQQKRQDMLNALVRGKEVMLANGIYGKISEVKENTFIVEIASGVCVEVAKNGVAEVIEQQEAGK
jgi:preprotein translocase YajC subunit